MYLIYIYYRNYLNLSLITNIIQYINIYIYIYSYLLEDLFFFYNKILNKNIALTILNRSKITLLFSIVLIIVYDYNTYK